MGGAVPKEETPAQFAERITEGKWGAEKHLTVLSNLLLTERFLTVSMPPRSGKTELLKYYILYRLAKDPTIKVIYLAFSAERAEKISREVRDMVKEYGPALRLALSSTQTSVGDWETTEKGGMLAKGLASATGYGGDLIIVDDPIADEVEATSVLSRDRLWDGFNSVAVTRINKRTQIIVVATRWHYDDLIGRIERAAEAKKGLPFTILRIPAKAEPGDKLKRKVGEYLSVEKLPLDENHWKLMEEGQLPWIWNAMYQQDPIASGSGQVQRTWWKFHDTSKNPSKQAIWTPDQFDQMIQSWDLNVKEHGKSYNVGEVWGRKGINSYLVDQYRASNGIMEVIKQVKEWHVKYPLAKYKYVEDKATGPVLLQLLQKTIPGMVPYDPGTRSKEQRLEAVVPMIAGGNVWLPGYPLPDGQMTSPRWVWEYIEEFAQFPKGVNDDQVDCTSQALAILMPETWKKIKEAGDLPDDITPDRWRKFQAELAKKRFSKWAKPKKIPRNWKPV